MMSGCGCKEYVHPICVGQWIEMRYENHIPTDLIRCPICNTYGILESPEPRFRPVNTIHRFLERFNRNQEELRVPLFINNRNHVNQQINGNIRFPQRNVNQEVDMRRFLLVTCSMFSIAFILLWILFIFEIPQNSRGGQRRV